MVLQEYSLFS